MAKGAVSDELARDGEAEALQDEKQTIQKNKNTDIRARQRAIGKELRRMYDEIAREPIPEDFLELLRQLDAKNENPKNEAKRTSLCTPWCRRCRTTLKPAILKRASLKTVAAARIPPIPNLGTA